MAMPNTYGPQCITVRTLSNCGKHLRASLLQRNGNINVNAIKSVEDWIIAAKPTLWVGGFDGQFQQGRRAQAYGALYKLQPVACIRRMR